MVERGPGQPTPAGFSAIHGGATRTPGPLCWGNLVRHTIPDEARPGPIKQGSTGCHVDVSRRASDK